jgi:nucleolar complex protein 2
MYLDYLKNCKFTSPTTLPLINFMQRSLVELYLLDLTVTYQHDFVFLRQLAVHLRTAIQNKKPVNRIIFNSI